MRGRALWLESWLLPAEFMCQGLPLQPELVMSRGQVSSCVPSVQRQESLLIKFLSFFLFCLCFFVVVLFVLAMPRDLRDLSSLTRDRTQALNSESLES